MNESARAMQDSNHNHYYGVQSDPKSDAAVGKLMFGGMVAVGCLALALNLYETVDAWWRGLVGWLGETSSYIVSFWPF